MENASKALLIAGGILLAMMILALLVYVGTSMSDIAGIQDRKREAQQLENFNKTYEAYNKTRMYGTDVITVVNKAIDYNTKLDTDETEYFINIQLELVDDFNTEKTTIIEYANGTSTTTPTHIESDKSLSKGTYNLCKNRNNVGNEMEQKVLNFFMQPAEDSYEETRESNKITKIYTYSAITNFKTAIFKCTDVSYEEGRIKSMTFTQL